MMNKGTAANLTSAVVLVVGYLLPEGVPRTLMVSAGLFALSGGLTNSIAVKMLFDRIPGLYGSGVIQTRFEEIREEIRSLILTQFFNREQLRQYLASHKKDLNLFEFLQRRDGKNPIRAIVETQWERLTRDEVLQPMVKEQVDKFLEGSVGGFMSLIGSDTIRGMVGKFVDSFKGAMEAKVYETAETMQLDSHSLGIELDEERVIDKIEEEVKKLLDQRLEQLTPAQVKLIIEDVIRTHLGWLVVWGNVFGGLLGLVAPFVSGTI